MAGGALLQVAASQAASRLAAALAGLNEAAQAEKATTLQEKSDVLAAKAATDEQLVAARSE